MIGIFILYFLKLYMISSHLNAKTTINNTLLVFFNDKQQPSLRDIKYDCLNLYNPQPNPWFFYHIDDYLTTIKSYRNEYENILLFGGSKGGSSAIVISYLLKQEKLFNKILSWVMSPILNIKFGQTLVAEQKFISAAWDKIKDNLEIKNIVEKYGSVYRYMDCSFPILYSYSYHNDHWMYDKKTFDSVSQLSCIIEDHVEYTEELATFRPVNTYQNIHNVLGYYWKIQRELFYSKLENFIKTYT